MSAPNADIALYFHMHLVSDSTGETLMNVAKASVAQFDRAIPIEHTYALVRSERLMQRVLQAIEEAPGVVVYTLVNEALRRKLELRCGELGMPCVAVLDPVLATLSRYLGASMTNRAGAQHELDLDYHRRIEALNFAMAHDDGQQTQGLGGAEVILVGVSRTSKTPTCIYLAHRGVRAGNIPLVPGQPLPPDLDAIDKPGGPMIVGLTAAPERLVQIRRNRLLTLNEDRETSYADEDVVKEEVFEAKRMFARRGWPVIDVTRRSVEETAAKIINLLNDRTSAE